MASHQTPLMPSRAPVLEWLGWDDVGPLQAFWLFGESVIPLLLLSLRVLGLGTMYREPSKLAVEVTSVQCELCALVIPMQRPAQRYFSVLGILSTLTSQNSQTSPQFPPAVLRRRHVSMLSILAVAGNTPLTTLR